MGKVVGITDAYAAEGKEQPRLALVQRQFFSRPHQGKIGVVIKEELSWWTLYPRYTLEFKTGESSETAVYESWELKFLKAAAND